ncbi:hypothetical protein BZG17_26210, partial [Escherichia coli]|nr:hypothetical protein [Escherichia coli]
YWDTEITIDPQATVKDVGSYTNKGENGPVSTPYPLPAPGGTATLFNPASHYSYPIVRAYASSGNDVKGFASAYTGATNRTAGLKYIHYPEFQSYRP